MSSDFHFVFVLSFSFKFSIFGHFSDKLFNFMCTILLQSITLSGLILLEEKSLRVLIF